MSETLKFDAPAPAPAPVVPLGPERVVIRRDVCAAGRPVFWVSVRRDGRGSTEMRFTPRQLADLYGLAGAILAGEGP